jgi:hypothetical protein
VDVAISVPALSFEASSCSFVGSALEALAYATLGDDNFTRLNSLTATALRDNRAIRLTRIAAASSLLDVPAYGIQIEMETGIALEHGELKFAADCGASTLRTLSWLLNYFQEIPLEVSLVDCAPATVSKTPDELDRNRAEVFFASASEEVQLASREASDPTDAWLALQSAHALALLHERCMKDAGKCSRYCEFVSTRLSEAAPRPGESEGRMVFAVLVSGHTQHVPSFLPLSNAVRDRLAGACRSHFQVSRDIFVSPLAVLIPGGLPVWDEGCFDEARRALCGVVETSEIDEGVEVPGGMPGALAILMSATLEDSQRLANAILEKDDSFQPSLPRVGTFISSGNPAALLLPDVLITALSFLEDEPCLKSLEEDAIQRVWLDVVRGEEIPGVFNISVTIYRETGDIVKGSGVSAVPAFWVNHLRKLLDARGIRLEVRYAG